MSSNSIIPTSSDVDNESLILELKQLRFMNALLKQGIDQFTDELNQLCAENRNLIKENKEIKRTHLKRRLRRRSRVWTGTKITDSTDGEICSHSDSIILLNDASSN